MNYQEYIDSGILQDYCLGLLPDEQKAKVEEVCRLHPEIKKELDLVQDSLEQVARRAAVKPKADLKTAIWNTLQNLEKEAEMSLKNLPVITKHSDSKKWLNVVKPLLPETLVEEEFTTLLQDTGRVMQKVYKTRKNYPDEIHHDIFESILVLEGKCTCKIGDKYFDYTEGDCISIPLHIVHNLTVTSPTITFVVQHLAA